MTVCVGVGTYAPGTSLEERMSNVDRALHYVKEQGRNRVEGFDANVHQA